MKKYYAKESIQRLYRIIGLAALALPVLIILLNSKLHMDLTVKILVFALAALISVLHFLRPKRCSLTIDDEEIRFHDGLMGRTIVPLDMIESIDYHPDLKFRIRLKKRKREVPIANVFSPADQDDILKTLKRKRNSIRINYLERPESLVTRAKPKQKAANKGKASE